MKIFDNMKRIVLLIISVAYFVSCQEEIDDTPQMQDAGTLEVSFAYDGNDNVKSHAFTPAGQAIDIEVKMNVAVGWMVSSDADWCVVDEEEVHRGNGTFSLAVKPNPGFRDRDDATVTLSAGDFTTSMRVIQYGNEFIIDSSYGISNKTQGSKELLVKVRDNIQWKINGPEWISTTLGEATPGDGYFATAVKLEWNSNEAESRFGTIGFIKENADDASVSFSLYQFGSEYKTTEDGTIILAAEKPSPIEIRVPVNTFDGVDCPKWVTYELPVDNNDNTESWYLYFSDNPSDTESVRDTEIELTIGDGENKVAIPLIRQDFYPAGGLLTAQGFKMFAERFNSNADISIWENNGVVKVVGHVDMSGLDEWIPIGTADRPFDLQFDGSFMTISQFQYSSPLFGVCKDAVISGVVFDETCSVRRDADYVSDRYLAPLAEQIINSQVKDCTSQASVEIKASAAKQGCNILMSGLVACMDETSLIKDCSVGGKIVTGENKVAEKGTLYIGGVAAQSFGAIESCETNITIADSSKVETRYVGGLVGYVGKEMTMSLSGSSAQQSDITVFPASNVYVGGLVGYAAAGLSLKAPSWNGTITYDVSKDNVTAQTGVSGIVGCSGAALDIEGAEVSGSITVKANNSKTYSGGISLGGVVGIASAGADIRTSRNACEITWATHTANSNGHVSNLGGIVGRIDKGIATITGCTNTAYLLNSHVNNNGYSKGQIKANRTGGIIGCYGYEPNLDKESSNITMTDCHNIAEVNCKRGFCGGLAGFLINASVNKCTYTGNITNKHSNPYAAGIAAGVERTTIEDCDVVASLYGQYQGSCYVRVGGIVGILYDSSSVKNCRYFGNITGSAGKTPRYGCIVGDNESDCSVAKCGMGGTMQGVEVLAGNYGQYIYGMQFNNDLIAVPDDRQVMTVEDCYYWNGK